MTRTGLILAGGESHRFGEPKPLAVLEGRSLIRWVFDALVSRCNDLVVSIGVRDDPARFEAAVPGARVIRDGRDDRGPIEGLRQGLTSARGQLVFVAPSDAPLLQPALYDALLAILGDHEAAVPKPGVLDPVRAIYRRDAALRVLQGDGVVSPSALADRLDAVLLEGDALRRADPRMVSFVDVNRREDLEEARRLAMPATVRHRY